MVYRTLEEWHRSGNPPERCSAGECSIPALNDRLNVGGLEFHIDQINHHMGYISCRFMALAPEYTQIQGFLEALNRDGSLTIFVDGDSYTGTVTNYNISTEPGNIMVIFDMTIVDDPLQHLPKKKEEFPHNCPECDRPLKFDELLMANKTKSTKFLKETWENPDIQLLCCSCNRKKERPSVLDHPDGAWAGIRSATASDAINSMMTGHLMWQSPEGVVYVAGDTAHLGIDTAYGPDDNVPVSMGFVNHTTNPPLHDYDLDGRCVVCGISRVEVDSQREHDEFQRTIAEHQERTIWQGIPGQAGILNYIDKKPLFKRLKDKIKNIIKRFKK